MDMNAIMKEMGEDFPCYVKGCTGSFTAWEHGYGPFPRPSPHGLCDEHAKQHNAASKTTATDESKTK